MSIDQVIDSTGVVTHILGPSVRLRDLSEGLRSDVERQRVEKTRESLNKGGSTALIGASLTIAAFLGSSGTPQHAITAMGAVWLCAVAGIGSMAAASSAEKVRKFADRARHLLTGQSVDDDPVFKHTDRAAYGRTELLIRKGAPDIKKHPRHLP